MNRIGILEQPRLPDSAPLARQVEAWLAARGIASWTAAPLDDEALDAPIDGSSLLIVLGLSLIHI